METLWFALVAVMVAVYVVLDGFDFGAGMLHPFVARGDAERRTVLAAIGPVWDGNEVWLLAGGGALFFAFPRAYAVAFSGFYLPLMVVLWLLVLRGISIELRSHHPSPLLRDFWDATLFVSSALMALVLGAALGNVIRGVPVDASGWFHIPFFTSFRPERNAGVLDWFTVLVGLFAVAALLQHGALYLAWKTSGPVNARAAKAARGATLAVIALLIGVTIATYCVQPRLFSDLARRPWAWPLPLVSLAGLAIALVQHRRGRERSAFLGSCAFLLGLLAATAAGLYPDLLRSTVGPEHSVNAQNAAASAHGLRVGFVWWLIGMPLATAYFSYLFRSFAGKVRV
jgi:cytochrome d ubiquinol oxidase subunit II